MTYDDVVVPTDGSPGIDDALAHARRIASGRLHLLHVVDRRLYLAADDDEADDLLADLHEEGETALADAGERLADEAFEVLTELREGVPFREIRAHADAVDADVVVMGSHGHRGREKRVNLGSTTERVLGGTDRPVLVVDIGD